MKGKTEGVRKIWDRYKFVVLVMLIGVLFLLWPETPAKAENSGGEILPKTQDLQTEMAEILGTISGVGQVKVLLTLESDGERQLAQDTELNYSGKTSAPEDYSKTSQTVQIDGGSGDEIVVTKTIYPTYRGALIVCQGGDRADVKLAVTEAVAALTGLSADRITVAKWQ